MSQLIENVKELDKNSFHNSLSFKTYKKSIYAQPFNCSAIVNYNDNYDQVIWLLDKAAYPGSWSKLM